MSLTRKTQQWGTFARMWHIYDATWQDPYKSAVLISHYLRGIYKPIYHPTNDCGDHVVIINSNEIALRGDEWIRRVYFHHTTYPQGASWTKAWELHKKDPTMIIQKAVYSVLGNNLTRRTTMQRLHVYYDNNIPEKIKENLSNQIKQLRPVPIRLDHISQEQLENFPQIINLPAHYVLH
ncbi:PREDICTED: 39S ribosomal protein L13, mitochondrial [Ceratosolen solmsi marchali]|uniref:39S ribosomal protein L13, mitochondrial n=1 Tax=Ceratosolen solmsi marchali TaxID=326594 RepID=A0AAJ6YF78_9HYME|nr:PREDICTED: 39S ribosomal protein L13, mitochondrial [Ceratosolen solmsi marchali]